MTIIHYLGGPTTVIEFGTIVLLTKPTFDSPATTSSASAHWSPRPSRAITATDGATGARLFNLINRSLQRPEAL